MTDETKGAVGYGRPPVATQFKPGRSGNPSGRPKKSKNLRTELLDELADVIRVSENNSELEVSKGQAIAKVLVRLAIDGNMRAMAMVLSWCARQGDDAGEPQSELGDPHDTEILNDFVGRELRRRADQPDGKTDEKHVSTAGRNDKNEK